MAQNQSKLEPVFSYSFPANHLLQFSIVKQEAEQNYKKTYFCFITLAPGVSNQQTGGRTFDFNNRVTMKVEGYQITELAHALRSYARGQETALGPFSIYVDTGKSQYGQQGGGQGKSLTVQRTQTQPKQGDNRPPAPLVAFFFKVGGGQALGYSMTPYRALAIADKLDFLGKKCDDLEFMRGPVTTQTGAYENPGMGSGGTASFADPIPPMGGPSPIPGVADNFAGSFNQFANDDVPF